MFGIEKDFQKLMEQVYGPLNKDKMTTPTDEELQKENKDLKSSKEWYASRCELLQKVQKYMRDPERTIVCDILANNSLLPDPSGERYGQDLWKLIYGTLEELAQEHSTGAPDAL